MTEDVEAERPWGRGKSGYEEQLCLRISGRPGDTGRGDHCFSADVPLLHCAI